MNLTQGLREVWQRWRRTLFCPHCDHLLSEHDWWGCRADSDTDATQRCPCTTVRVGA